MVGKIISFVAGAVSGFAACLAVAALIPLEDESFNQDEPWQ